MDNKHKLRRYTLLLKRSAQQVSHTAMILDQAKKRWLQEKSRLEDLESYRNDYYKQGETPDQLPVSVMMLNNQRGFLNYLETIINQQSDVVLQLEQRYSEYKGFWMKLYQKDKSWKEYVQKIKDNDQLTLDKKLQLQQDQFVADRYGRLDNKLPDNH